MSWELSRVLVDFGLLVLIWLVQLIIYPSFKFHNPEYFPAWHSRYSFRIGLLVIPLMFGQLGIYVQSLMIDAQLDQIIAFCLILVVWIVTFVWIVPVHNALGIELRLGNVQKLVKLNGIRTFCWTTVFLMSFYKFIYES